MAVLTAARTDPAHAERLRFARLTRLVARSGATVSGTKGGLSAANRRGAEADKTKRREAGPSRSSKDRMAELNA
jgi:hypothetical protein